MSKNKTFRRLSSAALLSLAVYGTSLSPSMVQQVNAFETKTSMGQHVRSRLPVNAIVGRGRVKSTNGLVLVVTSDKDGKDYTVNTDEKTKFFRRFGSPGNLAEIEIGHEVNVVGKYQNGDDATILAKIVRDLSIQKKNGEFVGIISSISGNNIMLDSNKRGLIAVDATGAVLHDRQGNLIPIEDILVGHKIKAKGMWDMPGKTLSEVVKITDYNLPAK